MVISDLPHSQPQSSCFLRPASLSVVMVEPRIPQNVGNVARLCACVGAPLYLVGDLGFRLNDKHLERAAMDYLDSADLTHLPDMDSLAEKTNGAPYYYLSTKAKQGYTDVSYPENACLVFGREDKGLPEWVINENPQTSVRIPMVEEARSLNVANSVAIVLYEAVRQHQFSAAPPC